MEHARGLALKPCYPGCSSGRRHATPLPTQTQALQARAPRRPARAAPLVRALQDGTLGWEEGAAAQQPPQTQFAQQISNTLAKLGVHYEQRGPATLAWGQHQPQSKQEMVSAAAGARAPAGGRRRCGVQAGIA